MSTPTSSSVEVIIVAYRSAEMVDALLESWQGRLPVCVADNSDGEDGLGDIVARHEATRYLQLRGLGFARAANSAIASSNAQIVVIVNPDSGASVEDIRSLAAGLSSDPQALAHGAVERVPSGRFYCGGWVPSLSRCFVHASGLHLVFPRAGILAMVKEGAEAPEVDWLSGSVAAFWRHHLIAAGGFDELFYVYSEDMALGVVARKLGLRHVARADVVVHPDAAGNGAVSLPMAGLQGASLAHYFTAYHRPSEAYACRLVLAAGFLARATLCALRGKHIIARRQLVFVGAILSGRALVEGEEVSEARAEELRTAGAYPSGSWRQYQL